MGVEVLGVASEGNGYGEAMTAFRDAHENNSRALVNLAMGRKKNDRVPPFDPKDPANAFPVMVYHAELGELTVPNEKQLVAAKKAGYRHEPYLKPQVALMDPAAEKKAMLDKNRELQGQLVAQGDAIAKLTALVAQLSDKIAAPAPAEAEAELKPAKVDKPATK